MLNCTLLEAISETDLCVCIVSSWSKHQSISSKVSRDNAVLYSSIIFLIQINLGDTNIEHSNALKCENYDRKPSRLCYVHNYLYHFVQVLEKW